MHMNHIHIVFDTFIDRTLHNICNKYNADMYRQVFNYLDIYTVKTGSYQYRHLEINGLLKYAYIYVYK